MRWPRWPWLLAAVACGGPAAAPPAAPCAVSTPILTASGEETGFARCTDGTVHRVKAVPADPTVAGPMCVGTEATLECTSNRDCPTAHSRCLHQEASPWETGGLLPTGDACRCVTACATDADCGAGACVPPEVHHLSSSAMCAAADCTADPACASGECSYVPSDGGCGGFPRLTCRTAEDTCHADADCTGPQERCAPPGAALAWSCTTGGCER